MDSIRTGRTHVVVMGVSATGKTTIGKGIARELDMKFIEGDRLHSPANIAKMSSGVALDDADRRPWLAAVAAEIVRHDGDGTATVTACSALRRVYRDWLREGAGGIFFVHLHADFDLLLTRMEERDHFMPTELLRSQFATLEPLDADELGRAIDVRPPPEKVLADSIDAVRGARRRG